MAAGNRVRETPYQDFFRIRKSVLTRRVTRGYTAFEDLFTDPSFPPDWSSLTYVYSGDDKYERTIFKRPPEIQNNPVFIGVGGVPDEPFPWRHWRQRAWFQAAISILSLNVRFLDKFLPGYRNHEQNFGEDYIGAFHFNIWRFGEWVDIIVDDYLPWLDDAHFFCKAIGNPLEYWAPLAEKAYAKCKKTFQAIEFGYLLDALTDLTGAVCEFFTPDVNPPENLFHILSKSSFNRSMVVCWRNDKRLTTAAFDVDECQKESDTDVEERRHLHMITATTKFPCKDGHTIEMIRLKCPFSKEPKWRGRYSEYDEMSWDTINAEFKDKYRPLARKEEDEYWLQMEDFRCNFGGLIIISGQEPYSQEGLNVERRFHTHNNVSVKKAQNSVTPNQAPQYKKPSAPYLGNVINRTVETSLSGNPRVSPLMPVTSQTTVDSLDISGVSQDIDIVVGCNVSDLKMDDCNERELVTNERELVTNERQPVTKERELVTNERQLVTNERELVTNERQLVTNERQLVTNERELVTNERELVSNERQLVTKERELVSNKVNGSRIPKDNCIKDSNHSVTHGLCCGGSVVSVGDISYCGGVAVTGAAGSVGNISGGSRGGGDVAVGNISGGSRGGGDVAVGNISGGSHGGGDVAVGDISTYGRNGGGAVAIGDIIDGSHGFGAVNVGDISGYGRSGGDAVAISDISGGGVDDVNDVGGGIPQSESRSGIKKTDDICVSERTYSNFIVEKRKTDKMHHTIAAKHSELSVEMYAEKENILNGMKTVSKQSPRIMGLRKTPGAERGATPSKNGCISDPNVHREPVESSFIDVTQNTSPNCAIASESKPCVPNKYNHHRGSHDSSSHYVTSRHNRRAERKQPVVPNSRKSNYEQYFVRKISLPQLPNAAFNLPNKSGNCTRRSSTPLNGECPSRKRLDSAASVSTVHSEARSCYSASEISIHIRSQLSVDDPGRPMSAPLHRNLSSGSLSSLTHSNFLATKADFFKSHGRWSCIVEHKGRWTKTRKGISRSNLDEHSKNPRIMFAVAKTDVTDCVTVGMQGKRHVLISVLQDYRHGPSTANSLLVPIGFCLYKAKHPDRDEKRHVSKLHLIGQVDGKSEMREVHSRFDVDPGCYFIVPYYVAQCHEGEFFVRVLAEGDPAGGKAGCVMS